MADFVFWFFDLNHYCRKNLPSFKVTVPSYIIGITTGLTDWMSCRLGTGFITSPGSVTTPFSSFPSVDRLLDCCKSETPCRDRLSWDCYDRHCQDRSCVWCMGGRTQEADVESLCIFICKSLYPVLIVEQFGTVLIFGTVFHNRIIWNEAETKPLLLLSPQCWLYCSVLETATSQR